MKLIQKPAKLIDLIIGKRAYNENFIYRPLKYLIFAEISDKETLVFNNLTKALILLNSTETQVMKTLDFSKHLDFKIKLVEMLFLVEENFNEKQNADSIRSISKNLSSTNDITCYTILPTTACNARCFYCYEAGTNFVTMDNYTAEAVSNYIINKSNGKDISIQWFGGEPLCNINAIDIICENLSKNKINFKSTMTTNGYNFDTDVVEKAVKKWHLQFVQITLDGLAETYNRVKNYKNNDKNAFGRIINNINLLSKAGIDVRIRLNMDYHNSDELYELAEYLHNELNFLDKISLYVMPLYENVGFTKTVHTEIEKEELIDSCINLMNHFIKLGFSVRKYTRINSISEYACQADNPSMVLILPNGDLGFCEHYLENDSFGTVYDYDVKKPFWCDYRKPIDKCNTCALYPTCLMMEKCVNGSLKCDRYTIYSHTKSIEHSMKHIYEKNM